MLGYQLFLWILAIFVSAALFLFGWTLVRLIILRKQPSLAIGRSCCTPDSSATVVIAARNEAKSLPRTLKALLCQEGVKSVVLVDDHSQDETYAIAQKIASNNSALVVMQAPSLPAGWTGKNHALYHGAQKVSTDYIVFTDADVILANGLVKAAMDLMYHEHIDHISGNFFVECYSVAEDICAPVLAVSSAIALFGSANAKGSATGAFNVIRTDCYRRFGGHNAIRDFIVDDVCLARCATAHGAKSRFLFLADGARVRLFEGFSGFIKAVARSSVPYLGNGFLRPLLWAGLLMLLTLAVTVGIIIGVSALVIGAVCSVPFFCGIVSMTAYCVGLICVGESRRYHGGKKRWSVAFLISVFLLAYATASAAIAHWLGKGVLWRGRHYSRSGG